MRCHIRRQDNVRRHIIRGTRSITGRIALIPDLTKAITPPRPALAELLPQRHSGVAFTHILSATRLRTRRLPQLISLLLPEIRRGDSMLILDLR